MTTEARRGAYRLGLVSETAAALLLRAKGYRILATRYRTPAGELDIVARRGRHVAFVEVKARGTLEEGLFAISPRAQARIRAAAEAWLAEAALRNRLPADYDTSIDLIVVRPWRLPKHFAAAFAHALN